jgi:GTP-binding protein
MFIDEITITAKGGDGGDGLVSFRREKFKPKGGPNGGDGGRGGDVIISADGSYRDLFHLKGKHHFRAKNGERGKSNNRKGARGKSLIIPVPPGTLIKDADSGELIKDLTEDGDEVVIAMGGKGGYGNKHFATATLRAPRIAENGSPGEERKIYLELQLLVDVGLVGFPNAGKSTLLKALSKASPKIAEYPFTTLEPNLGYLKYDETTSFIVGDMPGLIEDAHKGAGLGDRFLRHINRSKILCLVIDLACVDQERTPVESYNTLMGELERYDRKLLRKVKMIVGNKTDLPEAKEGLSRLKSYVKMKVVEVSALHKKGIDNLIKSMLYFLNEEGVGE